MSDLTQATAATLLDGYRTKRLSPVEVTIAVLERIRRLDPRFNGFRMLADEDAIASARASEARWQKGEPMGLLDGLPTTIKDLSPVKGWTMLSGSRTVDPTKLSTEDAPFVARLREQGAVFLGKTTTPEYGWKGVTDSPATGISRNPWDPSKTCGGSSGGAAIAAAAGFGVLHQGGDGGGSIRIPAALCGVYGIKPSYGRVPRHPHGTGVVGQITHTGPITRTVADAALMLTVLARPDARDWLALPFDDRDYRDRLDAGVRGVRIAYSPDLGYAEVDPEVAAICAEAVKVFATLGATVDAATPKIENPAWAFDVGYSIGFAQMLRAIPAEKRALMDPGLIELAERGKTRTMDEFYDAWARRDAMAKAINVFMEDWDLLVTPQLPIAAFDVGTPMPKGMSSAFDWLPFTYPFNMSHHPAGTVPCGFTRAGLPVALQIVGRMHDDVRVLQASRAFETARPFRIPEL